MSLALREEGPVRIDGGPATLLDVVDSLVLKGTVLAGDLVLSIAEVDLVRVNLRLVLAAVETLERSIGEPSWHPRVAPLPRDASARTPPIPAVPPPQPLSTGYEPAIASAQAFSAPVEHDERREIAPPAAENAERDVARLVLALVEFLRRLMERQAIRRMEGGRLADHAIERMGNALARLEAKVEDLKRVFGLAGEDVDLDLGPLGRLCGPEEERS